MLLNKIQVVEFWDDPILSAGGEYYYVPKVVVVKKYVRLRKRTTPTKRGVLLRDSYTCQYCGAVEGKMTIDHVLPKSRGGKETWENLVCACVACNNFKANRTPEEAGLGLRRPPTKPGSQNLG